MNVRKQVKLDRSRLIAWIFGAIAAAYLCLRLAGLFRLFSF